MTVSRTDCFIKQTCKLGVRIAEPTTVCNTVRYVTKTLRIHSIEIMEDRFNKNIRVKLRHTVYRMTSYNTEISHTHLTVSYYTHLRDLIPVTREYVPSLTTETLVDFFNNIINSGQLKTEKILVPCFKSLGHYRMVSVRTYFSNDLPSNIPVHKVFINKDSHKLGNTKRRVSIIDMNSNLFGKIIYSSVNCHMISNYTLARCRYHKVLLRKSQKLTFDMVIGRIKNL